MIFGMAPSFPKRFLHNAQCPKDVTSRKCGKLLGLVYCVFPNMSAAAE